MVYTFGVVDVKEYISSGILESVVLGFSSEQERQEVSCLAHIYPEINEELVAIELAFERIAFDTAITPDASIKTKLIEKIKSEKQLDPSQEVTTAKIITMNAQAADSTKMWKMMAAASVVLAFGVAAMWVSTSNKSNAVSSQMASLQKEAQKDKQILTAMSLEQERYKSIQSVITEASMQKVVMSGTAMEPNASVRVMWSDADQKAVMVAQTILPPPTDMQYQLWAIADGVPVSLGVFNYDELQNMTEPFDVKANNVTAFAITLEKKGGSPTPTMDKMVVLGAIAS